MYNNSNKKMSKIDIHKLIFDRLKFLFYVNKQLLRKTKMLYINSVVFKNLIEYKI